jgi:hypothetical protein
MLLPVQHSTAVIEMSLFPTALLCRTQCRRICRRITTVSKAAAQSTRRQPCSEPVRLSLSVCLSRADEHTSCHRLSLPVPHALRLNNLRHAFTLFFSAQDSRRSLVGY